MSVSREAMRRRLLTHLLEEAAENGWRRKIFPAAERAAGLVSGEASLLFPGGIAEALAFCESEADRRMQAKLARCRMDGQGFRERIETVFRVRLSIQAPHHEALRRAIPVQMLDQVGLWRSLHATADALARAAGDRSTGIDFHTRRAGLAAVYLATMLVWLRDSDGDPEQACAVLARRLDRLAVLKQASRKAHRGLKAVAPASQFLRFAGRRFAGS